MVSKEEFRIREIDKRIAELNHSIMFIFPIWNMIDRKYKALQIELNGIKDEKQKLLDGQMMFSDFNF